MTTDRWGRTPARISWASMIARCSNRKHEMFPHYGGRGIRVCARWLGADGFAHFLADMGERAPGTTLDRIDNDGNYEPGNCRWATGVEQHRNRSDSRLVTALGHTRTLAEWAEITGIGFTTLGARLRLGWTPDEAVTRPLVTKADMRRPLVAHGQSRTLSEWGRDLGVGSSTIRERLRRGWRPEDAVSSPPRPHRRRTNPDPNCPGRG